MTTLNNLEGRKRQIEREIELEKKRELGAKLKAHFQRLSAFDDAKVIEEIDSGFNSPIAIGNALNTVGSADQLASLLDSAQEYAAAKDAALKTAQVPSGNES